VRHLGGFADGTYIRAASPTAAGGRYQPCAHIRGDGGPCHERQAWQNAYTLEANRYTSRRIVSQRLRSLVPDGALLARWGGEEFVCVLPDFEFGAVRQLADAMRRAVSNDPISFDASRVLRLAISIGIVAGASAEAVLLAADAALYEAKRSGRDRVVSAPAIPR
jgi:hypothetical protein